MLTDTKVRTAKPQPKSYELADANRLFLLVVPAAASSGAGTTPTMAGTRQWHSERVRWSHWRMKTLERLDLASQVGASHWRLTPDLADTLRRMGERGDIIRTMPRAYAARADIPALADQVIYDPTAADADRHYPIARPPMSPPPTVGDTRSTRICVMTRPPPRPLPRPTSAASKRCAGSG